MSHTGSWECDIVTNDPIWSSQIFRIFGLSSNGFTPWSGFILKTGCSFVTVAQDLWASKTSEAGIG
jgi:hypothetical protein